MSLSQSLNEVKYANLLLTSSASRDLLENPQKSLESSSSKRWKLATSYGDMGLKYRENEALAYMASRMPAVYSACYRILREVRRRLPDFSPTKVLDFGAGTGSVLWALREVWPRAVKELNLIEPSKSMQRAGLSLSQDMKDLPLIQSYDDIQALMKKTPKTKRKHDLVIASYVLGEIASIKDRISTVRQLWSLTRDVLVLVEPGTPHGFSIISQMRSHILWMEKRKVRKFSSKAKVGPNEVVKDLVAAGMGAFIVAPCPHDGPCPLVNTGKYCHFVQRLQRTSTQLKCKRSKGPLRGFEDEKFTYVVIRRGFRPQQPWPLNDMEFETLAEQKVRRQLEEHDVDEDLYMDASDDNDDIIPHEEEEDGVTPDTDMTETGADDENDGENKEGMIAHVACDDDMTEADTNGENVRKGRRALVVRESDKSETETDIDDEMDEEEENAGVHAAPATGWARIVFDPLRRGKRVEMDMCRSIRCDGSAGCFERLVVTKAKNPTLHYQARRSQWGDLWPC